MTCLTCTRDVYDVIGSAHSGVGAGHYAGRGPAVVEQAGPPILMASQSDLDKLEKCALRFFIGAKAIVHDLGTSKTKFLCATYGNEWLSDLVNDGCKIGVGSYGTCWSKWKKGQACIPIGVSPNPPNCIVGSVNSLVLTTKCVEMLDGNTVNRVKSAIDCIVDLYNHGKVTTADISKAMAEAWAEVIG